jgi:hypothetical protein
VPGVQKCPLSHGRSRTRGKRNDAAMGLLTVDITGLGVVMTSDSQPQECRFSAAAVLSAGVTYYALLRASSRARRDSARCRGVPGRRGARRRRAGDQYEGPAGYTARAFRLPRHRGRDVSVGADHERGATRATRDSAGVAYGRSSTVAARFSVLERRGKRLARSCRGVRGGVR